VDSSTDKAASLSALDMAKCGVEIALAKLRNHRMSHIVDRKLLLLQSRVDPACDGCVLASIDSEQHIFDSALKNITCSDQPHSLAPTVAAAFQLLDKYRVRSGVDHPAKGLLPWVLEQTFVVVLTNNLGSLKLSNAAAASDGSRPYHFTHHWDQKVFAYQIGESAQPPHSEFALLCQTSGGRTEVCRNFSALSTAMLDTTTHLMEVFHSAPLVAVSLELSRHEVSAAAPLTPSPGTNVQASGSMDCFKVPASLLVSKAGEWPLPECQWQDRNVSSLSPRPSRPVLKVSCASSRQAAEGGSATAFSSDQLQAMIETARAIGLHVDTYEVRLLVSDSHLYLHSGLAAGKSSFFGTRWCGVSVLNSNCNPVMEEAPLCAVLAPTSSDHSVSSYLSSQLLVLPFNFPHLLPLLQQARQLAMSQGSKPITANGVVAPLLLANPVQSLPDQWKLQMKTYLLSVPPYYFHSLYKLLKPLGLHVFISLLTSASTASAPHPENSISHSVRTTLKRQLQSTCAELKLLERQLSLQSKGKVVSAGLGEEQPALGLDPGSGEDEDFDTCSEVSGFSNASSEISTVSKRSDTSPAVVDISLAPYSPSRILSDVDRALAATTSVPPPPEVISEIQDDKAKLDHSNEKLQKYLRGLCLPLQDRSDGTASMQPITGETPASVNPPPLLLPPPPHDLLSTWESMRSKLYGNKGGGLVVSGLHVAGRLNATGGCVVRGGKDGRGGDGQQQRDWLFKACGGAAVPRIAIREMSEFRHVLSRKEALRDPELINPPANEDEPRGILDRKLDVNFKNPFGKSKAKMTGNSSAPFVEQQQIMEQININDEVQMSQEAIQVPHDGGSAINPKTGAPKCKKRSFKEFQEALQREKKSQVAVRSSSPEPVVVPSSAQLPSPEIRLQAHSAQHQQQQQQQQHFQQQQHNRVSNYVASESSQVSSSVSTSTMSSRPALAPGDQSSGGALPEGWSVRFSAKHQRDYWFNSVTGKSQWFPPS